MTVLPPTALTARRTLARAAGSGSAGGGSGLESIRERGPWHCSPISED